jgi:signal transduction histidine kinase
VSGLFDLILEDNSGEWMKRLIRIRWMMAFSTLIIILLANYLLPHNIHFFAILTPIIVLICFNIILSIYSRTIKSTNISSKQYTLKQYTFVAHLQIILDILFLTVFLHFLGGLETHFFFFYLIYIVIAGFLFERRMSFIYVGLANLIFLGLLLLEWQELIPHYNLSDFRSPLRFQQPIHIFATSFTLLATSLLIAHIVSTMVEKLREREKELTEMNVACELKTHELIESNLACELKSKELAESNLACELKSKELAEANLSCELKTKELDDLNTRLKKLDEARTQFIWAVTHEMRAPVSAIQSYMNLILQGYIPPEKVNDVIHKSERQAIRQLNLINDLLQLAQLEDPSIEVNVETINIVKILEEVMEPMQAIAEENGVLLRVQIDNNPAFAKVTPEHIKSLWTNLISNAIKYTNSGGSVDVTLTQDQGNIIGTVKDNGIGISDTCLPHIFDQFYRAKNARSVNRQGTGLGLSIVKRILETYGGDISVESKPDEGTTFIFTFPKSKEGSPLYSE